MLGDAFRELMSYSPTVVHLWARAFPKLVGNPPRLARRQALSWNEMDHGYNKYQDFSICLALWSDVLGPGVRNAL